MRGGCPEWNRTQCRNPALALAAPPRLPAHRKCAKMLRTDSPAASLNRCFGLRSVCKFTGWCPLFIWFLVSRARSQAMSLRNLAVASTAQQRTPLPNWSRLIHWSTESRIINVGTRTLQYGQAPCDPPIIRARGVQVRNRPVKELHWQEIPKITPFIFHGVMCGEREW